MKRKDTLTGLHSLQSCILDIRNLCRKRHDLRQSDSMDPAQPPVHHITILNVRTTAQNNSDPA